MFEFLKLSSRAGGGDRGDGCCDAVTICGFGDDIDAIGIKSDDIFSKCPSRSPIIGSLQSTILMPVFVYAALFGNRRCFGVVCCNMPLICRNFQCEHVFILRYDSMFV